MPEQTVDKLAAPGTAALNLAERFPPVPADAWDAAVRQDLKGADYDRRLLWQTDDGLTFRPYYRAEDVPSPEGSVRALPLPPGHDDRVAPVFPPDAIRADLLHDAGATPVQELGYALADAVDRLAAKTGTGMAVDEAASATTFVFAVGSAYFVEIAKLRAARLLWAQAVAAFGPTDPASQRMRLIVRTARANKSVYDPYTNLLRATTEAMSAIIGGCDGLDVEPFGFDAHLAANVSRILREESRIDAVTDPAAGSYFLEVVTDALASAAWELMQTVEKNGGFAAASKSDHIADSLAASRAAREKAVSSRRRTVVGVNNYPDLGEKEPTPVSLPDVGLRATSSWRLAQPFEQIRERTVRHARTIGRYPRVLLLTRGDVKMRMARANFSRNFFGCAGFDIVQSDRLEGHDADLVVLCSADPEYVALANAVCPVAGVPVIVAGYPKDQFMALEAAGVAGFVHLQSDAIQTLTMWQDRLGMA